MNNRIFKVHYIADNFINNDYIKFSLFLGTELDFINIMQIVESKYFNFQGGVCNIYKSNTGFIVELDYQGLDNCKVIFSELQNY